MDLERFQGRWYYNRVQEGGAELELKDETYLSITGNKLSIEKGGAVIATGTISLEPAAKPRAFDLKLGSGEASGKVRKGIYNFDGATLQVCLGPPGGERPTGFQTSRGDGWSSITLKRGEQKK
jgi:uncharacterized protein (TIGR03067 family)